MFFHLTVTPRCDGHCRYCEQKAVEDIDWDFGGSGREFELDFVDIPERIEYDPEVLRRFVAQDPDPPTYLTFYGGEPLLEPGIIRDIMDEVPATYMVQTNGLHLDQLSTPYINRFHTILVSLDGDEGITDHNRGERIG